MNFEAEASGGLRVCGRAIISFTVFIFTAYGPGDVLFAKHKARKGIYEKVRIKKVTLVNTPKANASTGAGAYPMYTDTFNGVWFNNDLVDLNTANAMIDSFIAAQGASLFALECNRNGNL